MTQHWDDRKPVLSVTPDTALNCPRVEALDAFEVEHNFKLPESYREYALSFGLGYFLVDHNDEYHEEFTIALPGFDASSPHYDPMAMTRRKQEVCGPDYRATYAEWYDDGELAARLLLFCRFADVGFFGWDPDEVTDARRHERAIYKLENKAARIKRVASTFSEFVDKVICEGRVDPSDPSRNKFPSPEGDLIGEDRFWASFSPYRSPKARTN